LFGCYFAACHSALKMYSRSRLTDLLEAAGRGARVESLTHREHGLVLMTGVLRVGCGVALGFAVLYWIQSESWVNNRWLEYLLAGVLSTALLSIFLIAIPVSWARYRSEHLLTWSIPILDTLMWVFVPLATALHCMDPIIRRLSGVDIQGDNEPDISDDILTAIDDHEDADEIDQTQREMVEAVIELQDTTCDEVMTPRTDIEGIEVDTPILEVKKAILDSGHSRIPVYEESLDNILGILYVRDLIHFVGSDEDFHLKQVIREPFMVPESKSVRELLSEMKSRKVHMAVVIDEYGGTSGLVTIEDILEEIVGEIQDEYEHDEEEPAIRDVAEGVAEIDARVEIDDLEDHLGIAFPEDREYDTVGGFVFAQLGHIPEVGETFECEGFRFTVTGAERTKVLSVRSEAVDSGHEE